MRATVAAMIGAALLLSAAAARADALGAACLQPRGAGEARCPAAVRAPDGGGPQFGDLGGAWGAYRLLGRGEVRRCRLAPTCSLFGVQAVRRLGVWLGMLALLARIQMEHGPQGGWLRLELASDGEPVYIDPLTAWTGP